MISEGGKHVFDGYILPQEYISVTMPIREHELTAHLFTRLCIQNRYFAPSCDFGAKYPAFQMSFRLFDPLPNRTGTAQHRQYYPLLPNQRSMDCQK